MKKFDYLKVFFSPFKRPKIKFYFGKISVGVPYFYPRRAIKDPEKPGYLKFVDKKLGFDFVSLGWKTKWSDYRLEWEPRISFVFWKWQFVMFFYSPHSDQYWTMWLYYSRNTNKSLTKKERIKQCVENFPQIWTTTSNGTTITTDYYQVVLKEKYRPLSVEEAREKKLKNILNES